MAFRGVLVLAGLIAAAAVAGQVPTGERQALVDLYHATGGEDWHDIDGWLGEAGTECSWFGVTCHDPESESTQVRYLDLPANALEGGLPASLGDLAGLERLRLVNNRLEGPIPAELGNLVALRALDLGGNRLDGPVPGELLNTPATSIRLAGNLLSGFTEAPGPWPEVPGLAELWLSRNPIAVLPPPSWRDSGRIRRLELDRIGIAGELDFDHHPWLGLTMLNLAGNAITGFTGVDAATLESLNHLNLSGNRFEQQWPVHGDLLPLLNHLDLSGNGLAAAPPGNLIDHPNLKELRLADNALSAEMIASLFSLPGLWRLDLARNPLAGLPEALPAATAPLSQLDLAHTSIEGKPPDWFADLALTGLNLAGNRIGSVEAWLEGLNPDRVRQLDLSANDLEGAVPAALLDINLWANSLNLCWNDFDQPFETAIDEMLEADHVAGLLADCNQRDLAEFDAGISGSWFAPERAGSGYSLMLLDNGQLLHYWFGFPFSYSGSDDSGQRWSLQQVRPDDGIADFPLALTPRGGLFDHGLGGGWIEAEYSPHSVVMARQAGDGLTVRTHTRPDFGDVIGDPPPPPTHERFDHLRLSELAGTRCDNQSDFQKYSGAWFNPEKSGEGFIVEALPDNRGVIYWFTYAADGSGAQAWMIGDGDFDGPGVIITPPPEWPVAWIDIETMYQPRGTTMGPGFDSEAIDYIDWGSLRIDFHLEGTARVFWESDIEGFGSGDDLLERLARPMLAECGDQEK